MQNPFVTTDWLAARLGDPNLVVVDASWYLPTANRQPHEEYLAGHIPGAVFFDIDGIADRIQRPAAHAAGARTTSPKRSARSASATA